MVDEIVRVLVDHGVWGLVLFLLVLAARSRPARELSRCGAIEIRWRYLRWKGIPEDDLRRLLLDEEDDDDHKSEPPITAV